MSDVVYRQPAELLRTLIRFDTTNPPGNERECILYLDGLLRDAGFETQVVGLDDNRLNLVTRLKGRGEAPALLMHGHVDVVTTAGQHWQHPPFLADLADGYIWGRGALDMKGGVAMMVAALLRAKAEGLQPAGDVVLAVVSDEEVGGAYGARYLVEQHAQLFDGVRYSIGEFGGFSVYIGGRKFYLVQVAEKQRCVLRGTIHGPGGHGSGPLRGGAMGKLGRVLSTLDTKHLPVHITPVAQAMLQTISEALPPPTNQAIAALLNPAMTDAVLEQLGPLSSTLNPILHNTASPTIVRGGDKINVHPSEIVLELDGRILPGFTPDDILAELHALLGDDIQIEALDHEPGPPTSDMRLFETMAAILREADPEGIPVPYLLTGVTDARHFARLGIQHYGFNPLNLPADLDSARLPHAADERVTPEAVEFGAECVYALLQRFGS
jgi:acetylornithine deacetylase/succinyl-diaminopimelate desuccinylase-like protein